VPEFARHAKGDGRISQVFLLLQGWKNTEAATNSSMARLFPTSFSLQNHKDSLFPWIECK